MKTWIPVLILTAAYALQPAFAENFADVSPFRIDVETDAAENYQHAFLYGSDDVAFNLSQAGSGEAYYLGIDTSGQFAAQITGLVSNYPSFVRGAPDGTFAVVGTEFSSDRIGEIYIGRLEGLRPVFESATAYSLEAGYESISVAASGYVRGGPGDSASGAPPVGFAVAQHVAEEQPVTLFIWDAEAEGVAAATRFEVPSLEFDHGSSYFSASFMRGGSGTGSTSAGYVFGNWSATTPGPAPGAGGEFVALFDEDLVLTDAFTIGSEPGSTVNWQAWSYGDASDPMVLTGWDFDLETGEDSGDLISLVDRDGNPLWNRRYSHGGEAFSNLTYVETWDGELFFRGSLDSKEILFAVSEDNGEVERAFDHTDVELFPVDRIDATGEFLFAGRGQSPVFPGAESHGGAELYGTMDGDFANGTLHRLSVDVPDDATVDGWYHDADPALSEAQISRYDSANETFQTWLAVEDSCDIFETASFSLSPVSVDSVVAEAPVVTPVEVTTTTPEVGLAAEPLDLPEVTEEPSTRVTECFGGGSITPTPDTWYASASSLDDGWRYFDWFKGFKPDGENWIYHGRHGWLYVLAEDTTGMFLWDVAMERWLFTNATIYPWLFAYGPDEGWVFFFEGGRPGSRYFRRADDGRVVSEGDLATSP